MSRLLFIPLVLALLLTAAATVPGATPESRDQAIEKGPGKVVPLSEILATVRRIAPGKVLDVELEYDIDVDDDQPAARWVYEVEVLTDDHRVVELEFDAKTGQLLEIEGAPWPAGVPRVPP